MQGFRATLQKVDLAAEEWEEQRAAPEPPFVLLAADDLLPPEAREGFPERRTLRRYLRSLLPSRALSCFAPLPSPAACFRAK